MEGKKIKTIPNIPVLLKNKPNLINMTDLQHDFLLQCSFPRATYEDCPEVSIGEN